MEGNLFLMVDTLNLTKTNIRAESTGYIPLERVVLFIIPVMEKTRSNEFHGTIYARELSVRKRPHCCLPFFTMHVNPDL